MKKVIETATAIMVLIVLLMTSRGESGELSMFRANLQRTGVYNTKGVPQLNELLWKFKTRGAIGSSPAVAEGVVYVGNGCNHLYAIDSKTGQEKWKFHTGCGGVSTPAIAEGVVYVGNGCNHLYAIDSKTGQEKWFNIDCGGVSTPAITEGVVYVGSTDSHLYAVDSKTGQEKWKFKTGDRIVSSPAVADGVVYFAGDALYAVR